MSAISSEEREQITFERIVEFVSKYAPVPTGGLGPEAWLGADLRIIGDDAEELLEAFAEEFEVDLSNMTFSDYFPDEATVDMRYYLSTVVSRKRKTGLVDVLRQLEGRFRWLFSSKSSYREITLERLLSAAREGKW